MEVYQNSDDNSTISLKAIHFKTLPCKRWGRWKSYQELLQDQSGTLTPTFLVIACNGVNLKEFRLKFAAIKRFVSISKVFRFEF